MLLPVGRRTPAGGIWSQPEREDTQAMAKSVSPGRKIGARERYCKVHFVPSGSQPFILSSPLRIFFFSLADCQYQIKPSKIPLICILYSPTSPTSRTAGTLEQNTTDTNRAGSYDENPVRHHWEPIQFRQLSVPSCTEQPGVLSGYCSFPAGHQSRQEWALRALTKNISCTYSLQASCKRGQ